MMDLSYAARRRHRVGAWIATAGAAVTGAQALLLATRGRIVCLNEGCRVVESLTTVPPLVFNLLGCAWFALVAWLLRRSVRRPPRGVHWALVLLLGGMAAEGALLAYQVFVARALCSYCLTVFALVLAANAAVAWPQAAAAGGVLGAVLVTFAMLRFGLPPRREAPGLDAGTFAVRRCSDPAKQLYLIFSSNCPHCREVMRALENCNSCNFHFNPIDRISALELEGIERTAGYDPEVNRTLLGLLGADEVPVIISKGPEGMSVIRGESRILAYVREECFRSAPLLNLDPSRALDAGSLRLFRQADDGCNVTVECGPDGRPKQP